MSERAPLIRVVDVVGHADVLQTFVAGRSGQVVAGCKVRKGEVRGPAKGCRVSGMVWWEWACVHGVGVYVFTAWGASGCRVRE